jgi:hypothetical protein
MMVSAIEKYFPSTMTLSLEKHDEADRAAAMLAPSLITD